MTKAVSWRLLVGIALVSSLSACGAGSAPSGEDGTEAVVEVKVNELATVSVGDAEITFLQTEGESDISIEEQASIYAKQTPMQQLWNRGLTSLELFLSLAPDQVPPEALAAAHVREVEALGRDSDDIVPVVLDVAPTLEKSVTPAQCDVMWQKPYHSNNYDYGPWVSKASLDNVTGNQVQCAGPSCKSLYSYPDDVVLLGICNDSTRWLPYLVRERPYYTGIWRATGRYARPNTIVAHYGLNTIQHAYAIEGRPPAGVTYHLRSAIGHRL